MKPIPYGRQNITDEDIKAVVDVLRSDYLTQGPVAHEFERQFNKYIGSAFSSICANGTAALHIAAMVLSVNSKTRVITTPITFAASANCIRYCDGEVYFADIDPETFLIDLDSVVRMIEKYPKGYFHGIIPVDFAGYPVNMEKLREIADRYGLWVIEDACHAPGGYFTNSNNEKVFCGDGKYSELSIFSFHPVKHIAAGEGGMITTNSREFYNKCLFYRNHGITKDPDLMHENHGGWFYEMQELGYNFRMSDIHAALALSQLQRADEGLARREQIAARYNEAFTGTSVRIPKVGADVRHAWHLYVVQVENRKALYDHLKERNIFAQIHYIPVHLQPYYKGLGWKMGDCPVAEEYYSHCISLPMYPSLTDEQQDYVIQSVLEFIS